MFWINNAIIYHILIDRFAKTKSLEYLHSRADFVGGNLTGIQEKLDYLKNLGINTIWLSPFFETSEYHGYHITDFNKVEPRFGTINDLISLIAACKARKIRIIADIVPNHCSSKHKWFIDAYNNSKSQYMNWFYFKHWPDKYLRFLDFGALPKLNLENPEVSEYLIYSLKKWAELGFDGFRIDHIVGIPNKFLLNLKNELKSINPDFILIGEAWIEGIKHKHINTLKIKNKHKLWENRFRQTDVQAAYSGVIDGVLDFEWRNLVVKHIKLLTNNKPKLLQILEDYESICPQNLILPRFLDNHDTQRIMFECRNNIELFKEALILLYKQKRPVIIYYGTESGMTHKNRLSPEIPYSDLEVRHIMNWDKEGKYTNFLKALSIKRKKQTL